MTPIYEVIAIDNNSSQPIDGDVVRRFGENFSYHYFETDSPSPVGAVNFGVERATGEYVAVIVDGARMASPGLIGQSQRAVQLRTRPFVCSLSWHLGPEIQRLSMQNGYDQAEEDRLLASIDWPTDGYGLFEISTLAPSSKPGFLAGVPAECSWWTIRRCDFDELGGFDPRFESPGGGLVNHDFRDRAMALADISPISLLGEGVFHQFHGGVSTNAPQGSSPRKLFRDEYQHIRRCEYQPSSTPPPLYYGSMPETALRFVQDS